MAKDKNGVNLSPGDYVTVLCRVESIGENDADIQLETVELMPIANRPNRLELSASQVEATRETAIMEQLDADVAAGKFKSPEEGGEPLKPQ